MCFPYIMKYSRWQAKTIKHNEMSPPEKNTFPLLSDTLQLSAHGRDQVIH